MMNKVIRIPLIQRENIQRPREGVVIEGKGKNILFLSQFMKKKEKKKIIQNQNDVRKDIVWNKPLMATDSFVKIRSVLEIDYWPTLFEKVNCRVLECQK